MPNISNKKILMIIAYNGYQDLEYGIPREIFEKAGCVVMTASSSLGQASGKLGGSTKVDLTLGQVKVDDFDAIVFVGGPGASEYFDDLKAHEIAKKALDENKVLAAICIAPVILAKSGVLSGRKATVWSSSVLDKSGIDELKKGGAEYVDQNVVLDKNLITANGPEAAEKFAQIIIEKLAQ